MAACLLLVCALLRSHWWKQEHKNRVERLHDAIGQGITVDAVNNLLTYTNIAVSYRINTNGEWQSADRTGFYQTLGDRDNPSTNQAKMDISYVLPSARFSFEVLFNPTGGVARVGAIEKQ